MSGPSTSRRALLGGIAAAPAVLALGITTATAAPKTAPAKAGRWYRLKARLDAVRIEKSAIDKAHDDAFDAYMAEAKAIPHQTTAASYDAMVGERVHMNTGNHMDRVTAKALSEVPMRGMKAGAGREEWLETALELRELVSQREAAEEALRERYRIRWHGEQTERACDLFYGLQDQLMLEPAPDATAALFKLELLLTPDEDGETLSFGEGIALQALADARRFLVGEA